MLNHAYNHSHGPYTVYLRHSLGHMLSSSRPSQLQKHVGLISFIDISWVLVIMYNKSHVLQ